MTNDRPPSQPVTAVLGESGSDELEPIETRAWLSLGVTTLVTFLAVIDISAVNVAFPSIRSDFNVSETQLGWIISGYGVTVGALLLVSGRVADSIGRKRVFLPGVAMFGIGSLLCGLAPSVGLLIAARVVQAVGGAIVTASSFAVMLPDFPASRRSTAIGIAGATGALGAVAGPALGSVLIDLFSWRAIFFVNVPLCLLVLFLGPKLLNESSDPNATGNIDLAGVVIGTAGVALVMFGIAQSESWGLADIRVIALLVIGLALIPILIQRSRHHAEPLINLDLFDFRSFSSSCLGVGFYSLAFTSGFLANSLMLQDLWEQPIRTVGLALMPGPLVATVVSPLSGIVADRIGHRWVLTVGCSLCAISSVAFALLVGEEPAVWSVFVPIMLVLGVGIGLTVATWASAGLSDIPPHRFGVAGATVNTVRQAAYALGISVVIAIIASGGRGELVSYTRGWWFGAGCYLAAAAAIACTFPSGSSAMRAGPRSPARSPR